MINDQLSLRSSVGVSMDLLCRSTKRVVLFLSRVKKAVEIIAVFAKH